MRVVYTVFTNVVYCTNVCSKFVYCVYPYVWGFHYYLNTILRNTLSKQWVRFQPECRFNETSFQRNLFSTLQQENLFSNQVWITDQTRVLCALLHVVLRVRTRGVHRSARRRHQFSDDFNRSATRTHCVVSCRCKRDSDLLVPSVTTYAQWLYHRIWVFTLWLYVLKNPQSQSYQSVSFNTSWITFRNGGIHETRISVEAKRRLRELNLELEQIYNSGFGDLVLISSWSRNYSTHSLCASPRKKCVPRDLTLYFWIDLFDKARSHRTALLCIRFTQLHRLHFWSRNSEEPREDLDNPARRTPPTANGSQQFSNVNINTVLCNNGHDVEREVELEPTAVAVVHNGCGPAITVQVALPAADSAVALDACCPPPRIHKNILLSFLRIIPSLLDVLLAHIAIITSY